MQFDTTELLCEEYVLHDDAMEVAEFLSLSLNDLAVHSKTDKTRWSKYFNGQAIGEKTLIRIAAHLNMNPESLLSAINHRRKEKELHKDAR